MFWNNKEVAVLNNEVKHIKKAVDETRISVEKCAEDMSRHMKTIDKKLDDHIISDTKWQNTIKIVLALLIGAILASNPIVLAKLGLAALL